MIGDKETQNIYDLPKHYIQMIIDSVVSKRSRRSAIPILGRKISRKRVPKGGIVLLGGRVGQGKTSTVNTFMDTFEKDQSLSGIKIAYLNTRVLEADKAYNIKNSGKTNVRHFKNTNFIDKAVDLMKKHRAEELLVIIDQMDCSESLKAGLLLAESGYTVLGVVSVEYERWMSNVINSAFKDIDSEYEKELIRNRLVNNLTLLIMQDQNYPMVVKQLPINKHMAKNYINMLNRGQNKLADLLIEMDKGLIYKEWHTKNWDKK